jgi:hypothetical protein
LEQLVAQIVVSVAATNPVLLLVKLAALSGADSKQIGVQTNWDYGIRLLDLCQDLLLILDDRIQSSLVLQNGSLVLFDDLLIGLDTALVRENRLLVLQDLFLVCDNVILGHF